MIVTKLPVRIAKTSSSNGSVSISPVKRTGIISPTTGPPSLAVDMLVLESQLLAALTAQKQKAVARGP